MATYMGDFNNGYRTVIDTYRTNRKWGTTITDRSISPFTPEDITIETKLAVKIKNGEIKSLEMDRAMERKVITVLIESEKDESTKDAIYDCTTINQAIEIYRLKSL